jgi:four helix bundle protein
MVGMFNGDALLNGVIMNGKDRVYKDKLLKFAVRIVKLKNYLNEQKHEYNIADQIQRSGTSIGANHREAIAAESDVDFIHKLAVAQKECNETLYWLELLKETGYIDEQMFVSLYNDAEEIMRMLTASIITIKKKLKK